MLYIIRNGEPIAIPVDVESAERETPGAIMAYLDSVAPLAPEE